MDVIARLESIEEILKMLLVNSVFESEKDKLQENILNNIRAVIQAYGISNFRLNCIENRYYLFAEIEEAVSLNSIKRIYYEISEMVSDLKLVLAFDKLHPKRKKAFEDAGISFYVNSGEMRIF